MTVGLATVRRSSMSVAHDSSAQWPNISAPLTDRSGVAIVPIASVGRRRRPDSLGPHIRSIGLDAQSTLYDQLQGFCAEVQAKLVGGNAAAVFNLH